MKTLTVDGELSLSTAHGDARRHVDGNAAERTSIQSPVDGQDSQVAAVLVAATGVGQSAVIQCPVELDELAAGHITAQAEVLSFNDDLTYGRRVKVEAVLTAAEACKYCNHIKHIYSTHPQPIKFCDSSY